jgi:hypothetical protein
MKQKIKALFARVKAKIKALFAKLKAKFAKVKESI